MTVLKEHLISDLHQSFQLWQGCWNACIKPEGGCHMFLQNLSGKVFVRPHVT